jgi:Cu/Zn superoxide dismutase
VGSVKLNDESGGGVRVRVEVTGLPPGFHGFHIHSVGLCEAPFTTAGGHWNLAFGADQRYGHSFFVAGASLTPEW